MIKNMYKDFRILITDADYKHSIAIQKYLRKTFPHIYMVGHSRSPYSFARYYGYLDSYVNDKSLEQILGGYNFDMIIPVGAESVRKVSELKAALAVLPSMNSLEICFNKWKTISLARQLDISCPNTKLVFSLEELHECDTISYPCVIKPACETEMKFVYYARDFQERQRIFEQIFEKNGGKLQYGVLVQEYVKGAGFGFFALFDRGQPLRVFMHERIREFPSSGGASTAARSYYNEKLKSHGLDLLRALKWHGVAMVEFKYNQNSGQFVLMEVNPKFWGSTELALKAGVNFAVDLVRVYEKEKMNYSEEYNKNLCFYWPLDGDIYNLWQVKQLYKICDYFRVDSATNLFGSFRSDFLKFCRLLKHIFCKR
ncbi:ATP-grasp enzyme-like protein [Gammaproteobacteria bacterium]